AGTVLPESLIGYETALPEATCVWELDFASLHGFRTMIVPGVSVLEPRAAATLLDLARSGATIVFESAAAFLDPSEFASHQEVVPRCFGIEVSAPIELWSRPTKQYTIADRVAIRHAKASPESPHGIPYTKYSWPQERLVRDFSRIVPVSAESAEAIAF